MKQLETSVGTVMEFLKSEGFSPSVISAHRLCYKELVEFFSASGQVYSSEAAYQWVDEHQSSWSYRKFTGWRHCIDQLEDVRMTGSISLDHLSCRRPPYYQLDPYFRSILDEFTDAYPEFDDRYRRAGARFLLYLQNNGLSNVSELNYEILLKFHEEDYHPSSKSKDVYEDLIRKLLRHLSANGMCSPGLPLALNKLLTHQIVKLPEEELLVSSDKTYPPVTVSTIEDFISKMKDTRYAKTVLEASRHILTLLYIFLDMHRATFSEKLMWHWFGKVKPLLGSGWRQHRRSLFQFLFYLETGSIMTGFTGDPLNARSEQLLPPWQREPLKEYLLLLKREGRQPSTINMHRSSNLRFCKYLQRIGIDSFSKVTPSVLKDFNLQDIHRTPEGKAAYNCRIRGFVIYLYEQGLISDPYLYRALPTLSSPRASIVQTLSKDDIEGIWAVNLKGLSPIGLRDYAMVCIGLSMGFRASDITGLCFNNVDWSNRCIRITQQKTGKLLVMPMPVKTGNILFRYLCDGRPKSNTPFIFIRHEAPYGKLHRGACNKALKRFIGSSADQWHGFHVVRKTFATQLLEGRTNIELISDSLGHSTDSTVHKYLSVDEKGMRMCPLSLAETGISYKGGVFNA